MHWGKIVSIGLASVITATFAFAEGGHMGAVSLVQGVALFRARDYDGARRAFARAYEEEPSAGALFDLALAELQSGRSSDSVRHLRSYLTRSDAQADKLDAIRTRWLPQAEAHLARLEVQGTAGVEILVDGQSIGFTPSDDFELDGGQHSVVARKGSWSQEVTVVVRAGDFVAMRADVPELRALPEESVLPRESPNRTWRERSRRYPSYPRESQQREERLGMRWRRVKRLDQSGREIRTSHSGLRSAPRPLAQERRSRGSLGRLRRTAARARAFKRCPNSTHARRALPSWEPSEIRQRCSKGTIRESSILALPSPEPSGFFGVRLAKAEWASFSTCGRNLESSVR